MLLSMKNCLRVRRSDFPPLRGSAWRCRAVASCKIHCKGTVQEDLKFYFKAVRLSISRIWQKMISKNYWKMKFSCISLSNPDPGFMGLSVSSKPKLHRIMTGNHFRDLSYSGGVSDELVITTSSPSSCLLNLHLSYIYLYVRRDLLLHYKKRLTIFPSPAGMSLSKLSLAGNN